MGGNHISVPAEITRIIWTAKKKTKSLRKQVLSQQGHQKGRKLEGGYCGTERMGEVLFFFLMQSCPKVSPRVKATSFVEADTSHSEEEKSFSLARIIVL